MHYNGDCWQSVKKAWELEKTAAEFFNAVLGTALQHFGVVENRKLAGNI
jgi:hypothetical protein